jgi:EAL domain-containing protein (putative c-di-GMP-specific phosphodiesterase class I)
MSTTAEGVETLQQLGQLRQEGCTEVQGYLFSQPLPAENVLGLVEKVYEQLRHGEMPRTENQRSRKNVQA